MSAGRVLVTAGAGFIGRPALRELMRRGFEVHAVGRKLPESADGPIWHAADLLDDIQLKSVIEKVAPTHLLHLAWYVEHGKFWSAAENESWRQQSLVLLKTFAQCGGTRALFAGSCAEYDWNRADAAPWRESDPCRPATVYGAAKHALHLEAAAEAQRHGVSFAWARLFLMFGQGEDQRRLVPAIIAALKNGAPLPMSSGRQIRDFSDTRDIAAGLAALLAAGDISGPVNVASGEGYSLREVAALIATLAGQSGENLMFGALPDREEPPVMVADVTRLRREVGLAPPPGLAERLADYVREG